MLFKIIITLCITGYISAQNVTTNVCTGHPHGSFIMDVTGCNRYFRCNNGVAEPGACPSPWLFNGPTQSCDWAENVDCFSCPANISFINLPVANSCSQFIRCFENVPTQLTCPFGLYFDSTIGECNLESNVNCNIFVQCPAQDNPSQPVFLPDPSDCSVYYVCISGVPVPQSCPSILYFNPAINMCDFPTNVNCTASPPVTNPPTTSPPNFFECVSDGFFPHPSNCNLYFICASGTPFPMSCAQGLHWDSVNQRCDRPEQANCVLNFY